MEIAMLKKLTLFILAFLLAACGTKTTPSPTPSADQIDQEEQAVYAAVLKDLYGAPLYVLMDTTSTDPGGAGNTAAQLEYVLKNLHDVAPGVADSFKARNDKSYPLSPDMKLGVEYVLLSPDQRNQIFSQNQNGWDTFYQNYPSAPGLTSISRVGFNQAFDQAMVYVGTQSHYLAGAGYFLLLVKTGSAWVVSQKVMTWIS